MEIASSNINLSSQSSMMKSYEYSQHLSFWTNNNANAGVPQAAAQHPLKDTVSISSGSLKLLDSKSNSVNNQVDDNTALASSGDIRLLIIKLVLEKITGKKIDVSSITDAANGNQSQDSTAANIQQPPTSQPSEGQPQAQGWGLRYTSHEVQTEKQNYAFNAHGTIKTNDGKAINFSLDVNMNYEHSTETTTTLTAGDARLTDPLVINFAGNSAELTGGAFKFDLNSDGKNEKLPVLGSGSGFLALDLNNDGVINNGKELFGPATGNGYSELAAYDEDKNKWIDEKDSVFNKLQVLRQSQNGEATLSSLKDNGVTALYLGAVGGQFNYKDGAGNVLGQLAGMSIYTKEDGTVGTTEQVNVHT